VPSGQGEQASGVVKVAPKPGDAREEWQQHQQRGAAAAAQARLVLVVLGRWWQLLKGASIQKQM
jgi:hypothetical protein